MILLFFLLELKHCLADGLQTPYITNGKRLADGWFWPLMLHAGEHGIGTFLAVLICTCSWPYAFGAGIFDLACHAIIDRIKSSPFILGGLVSNSKVWMIITLIDQALHQLTVFAIIFFLWRNQSTK